MLYISDVVDLTGSCRCLPFNQNVAKAVRDYPFIEELTPRTLYLFTIDMNSNVICVDYLTMENLHLLHASMITLWEWYYQGYFFIQMPRMALKTMINKVATIEGGSDLTALLPLRHQERTKA